MLLFCMLIVWKRWDGLFFAPDFPSGFGNFAGHLYCSAQGTCKGENGWLGKRSGAVFKQKDGELIF